MNDIIQEIDSPEWKLLKRRYYYATKLSYDHGKDKKGEIFSLVFEAKENDMPIHISRYEMFKVMFNTTTAIIIWKLSTPHIAFICY